MSPPCPLPPAVVGPRSTVVGRPTAGDGHPTTGRAGRWVALVAAVLAVVSSGCVPGKRFALERPAPETLPAGSPLRSRTLPEGDAWLRYHLLGARYPEALGLLADGSPVEPGDALLRRLQQALVLRAAGEYRRSNEEFEWAEREADRRYTLSVSRAAGSLLAGDRVLAYTPPAAELAMIPLYRMLNYLALRDLEGAAVEAKKADALLARRGGDPEEGCREGALVQYLAGLVHGAAGERNDALVSLRQAERRFRACAGAEPPDAFAADLYGAARALGLAEVADSVAGRYRLPPAPPPEPEGGLVVLVEQGFVAHRAERTLHLPIFPEDVDGLDGHDDRGIAAAAATVSARLLDDALQQSAYDAAWDDRPGARWAQALDRAYILRLAWPVYRLEACRPAAVRVWVDGSVHALLPVGDLSAAARRELEADQPKILARLVARGMAKYLLTREVEKKAEEQGGDFAGFLAGRLSNLAGNLLERADTRSWSLLPDRISMARLRVPPGEHSVRIETLSASGEVVAQRELGTVRVAPGELVMLSERVWGPEQGELLSRPPSPLPDGVAATGDGAQEP